LFKENTGKSSNVSDRT